MLNTALTLAGSDSGGGAGIQADLKTFAAFGVYGTSAITAVTAQNTLEVTRIQEIAPDVVAAQIDAVLSDIGADAVKTGMLASAPIIEAVAAALDRHPRRRLVVDPVMVSKSGAVLLRDDAVEALVRLLLPRAEVVTPNLPEAERLAGRPAGSDAERRDAARRILDLGVRIVVIKGGHDDGPRSVDLYFDGAAFTELPAERLPARHTHGTGCTFSAAVTAGLALGQDPLAAAGPIGRGIGPVDDFHAWRRP